MRNLRKYFAVFIAIALVLSAVVPAFAADTATTAPAAPAAPAMSDAKVAESIGVLKGGADGVTDEYLASAPSKLQAAIMFLRLKGLEKEALAAKGTENFKDADKVDWDGGVAVLAYLKSKPELGFVGNPDGTFDPNATVTAQQYYKILLVALGYKEDTGKGGDFKYDDTLKFAESKGLKKAAASKNFSINDLAISTVEALKANTADGKQTFIDKLIADKVIDAKKAEALKGPSGPASSFTLTAKTAKSLYAKLNGVVADTSKVTIDVTRDAGIKTTLTAAWDKDKGGAVLTTDTNLVSGDYTVAIKDDKTDLGKQTVKIESEKIAKIEMVSKSITRRSDSEGVAYYKVTNQYGDDVTKAPIASNITWNSSLGTNLNNGITSDKGILTLYKNDNPDQNVPTVYMGLLKDQASVVVTAYDSDSNVTMNESLTVSATVGDIQSIKLLGITNKDKKTKIEKATTDVFYLDFEAKDSNGNLVTDYKIFANSSAFRLSPGTSSESTVAYAEVVQDPDNNKMAKIQVKVPQSNGIAGTQILSAVCISTGKSANFSVDVVEGSVLQQLILQKPAQDVAINDGFVEIPYIAMDSNGATLTEYSKINTDKLAISGIDSTKVKKLQNPDGSFKLLVDFGSTKTQYTLSATVNTTTTVKMSTITVSVKEAAYPKSFISLKDTKFTPGVVYRAKTGDKMSEVKVLDQYDRNVNLRHYSNKYYVTANNTTQDYYFYVRATIGSSNSDSQLSTISLGGFKGTPSATYKQIAFGNAYKIELFGNEITGSVSVNFELVRATSQPTPTMPQGTLPDNTTGGSTVLVNTDGANATAVDSKIFTFYNVDKKDIQSYFIDEVKPLLYANQANFKANEKVNTDSTIAPIAASGAKGSIAVPINSNSSYDSIGTDSSDITKAGWRFKDTWYGEAMSDAKIRGKYNGLKVALVDKDTATTPAVQDVNIVGDIVSYTVSDTSKFQTFFKTGGLNTDYKVWAKYFDQDPYTGTLTVAVKGYQGVVTTASVALNSKTDKATGTAQVEFEDAIYNVTGTSNTVLNAENGNLWFRPIVSLGTTGDVFKTTAEFATRYFAGVGSGAAKRIYKFAYDPTINQIFSGHKYAEWNNAGSYAAADSYGTFTNTTHWWPSVAPYATANAVRSSIFFSIADQYGKTGAAPVSLSAVTKGHMVNGVDVQNVVANSATGKIYFIEAPQDGESITLTAVSSSGSTKAITIYIDNTTDVTHAHQ